MATRANLWRSLALTFLLAGCGGGDSASFHVVVLGDESRFQVVSQLSDHVPAGVRVSTPAASSSAIDVADDAAGADFALLVVDATVGPTPILREHALVARQVRIPAVGILLSNTDSLLEAMGGDRDLHELVGLELREILQTYEVVAETPPRFYDSETFDPSSSMSALAASLGAGSFPRRAPESAPEVSGTMMDAEVYVLTAAETAAARPIAPGDTVSMWIDAHHVRADAELATPVSPGDAAAVSFQLDSDLSSRIGARFFIESDGYLVAVGTVTALE